MSPARASISRCSATRSRALRLAQHVAVERSHRQDDERGWARRTPIGAWAASGPLDRGLHQTEGRSDERDARHAGSHDRAERRPCDPAARVRRLPDPAGRDGGGRAHRARGRLPAHRHRRDVRQRARGRRRRRARPASTAATSSSPASSTTASTSPTSRGVRSTGRWRRSAPTTSTCSSSTGRCRRCTTATSSRRGRCSRSSRPTAVRARSASRTSRSRTSSAWPPRPTPCRP